MAVQKLSQIAAAGVAPAVTDQAVFVTGGTTDNLVTVNQLGTALPVFTSTARGQVPASGGVATTFLNGAGAFTTPGATAPGGANTQVQFNNAAAFGGITNLTTNGTNLVTARFASTSSLDWDNGAGTVDVSLFRDTTNILALRVGSSATPMGLRVYNNASANTEWGTMDWTEFGNQFTIGTVASGGGTARQLNIISASPNIPFFVNGSQGRLQITANSVNLDAVTSSLGWSSGGVGNAPDTGLSRTTTKVVAVGDGGLNTNGWIQTAGDLRVGSDIGFTSNVVLATIMSVALQAGRSYAFDVYLSVTGSAGGLQAAMVASGGLTATAIQYDGYVVDNAAAGTKGAAQASALGTVVANPATIVGPASATIRGLITVNVAGTIQIQASQGTSSATTTTVKRGSWAFFRDTP